MREVTRQVATERKLRDAWQWLPTAADGFSVEMCADAVVSVAEPADPYRPVQRFGSLLAETDRFRFVGSDLALLEPLQGRIPTAGPRRRPDGDHRPTERRSARALCLPGALRSPLKSGNLTVRVHDDVPSYGLALFDDRIGIVGYSTDSGTVQVLIDTDTTAARKWAEATYASYRSDSRPLSVTLPA